MPRKRAGAHGAADVVNGDLLLTDELLEDVLVELGKDVDQFGSILLRRINQVGRDVHNVPRGA